MNLTVEQLLEQVKHFLSTGQPRMAALYMEKALTLLFKERVVSGLEKAWEALRETFAPFVAFVTSVAETLSASLDSFGDDAQDSFCLGGPA